MEEHKTKMVEKQLNDVKKKMFDEAAIMVSLERDSIILNPGSRLCIIPKVSILVK